MKRHLNQNIATRLRGRLGASIVLGSAFLMAALLVLIPQFWSEDKAEGVDIFYFSPQADNHYANPANWSPTYPGTYIFKDQKVVIQGQVNLPFYDLQVEGKLELGLDAQLFSPEHGLIIKKGGQVDNHGEIVVAKIEQEGHFNNNFTGKVDAYRLHTGRHSQTFNLLGAEITVKEDFLNQGKFNNYGKVLAEERFHNTSQFYQMGSSSLLVKGQAYRGAMAGVLP